MVTDEALFPRKAGLASPDNQATDTSARSREAIIQVRGLTNRFGKQLVTWLKSEGRQHRVDGAGRIPHEHEIRRRGSDEVRSHQARGIELRP